MTLDLSSMQKAVGSLERAIQVATGLINGPVSTDQEEVIQAGVIQNFEFTYEMSWKFIKRWLEINVNAIAVDGVTRKELYRMAAESGLIGDVEDWFEYHRLRNQTAHTYDAVIAAEVFAAALRFVHDAKELLRVLETRND